MRFVVKNTTKCGVLDLLCPHSCRGCGRLGCVLCERCKKNMVASRRSICPLCKREIFDRGECKKGVKCLDCDMLEFMAIYAGGWREGVLGRMVEEYKYQSVWAMGEVLAEVLDEALPGRESEFWREINAEDIIVVPLPTIGRHVRERGLNHTLRVARKLAKRRGWRCEQVLLRAADTVQVGAKASEREEQARRAYMVRDGVGVSKTYVLVDDVWTTGASMRAAAKAMRAIGVEKIIGVVVAVGRPHEQKNSSD